ncbi:MAG: hypothetical protein CL844_02965 [Crocinitomicaceae bacterium]|nr:hypothetical protein [Crocinitomicaceae bacterium]|tara:strand:- start:13170 stop:13565 length:396 start_codon:yes stop_codon:yes gene_type:complete
MVLKVLTLYDIVIGILYVSIIIFIVVIIYRKILVFFSRKSINHDDYCKLDSLESNPAIGKLSFYFTSNIKRSYRFVILDINMFEVLEVVSDQCSVGGNIINFDSSNLPNGNYFYSLQTENQKIIKKMTIEN